MFLKMADGDYIPDGAGGFRHSDGQELLLQQALFLLTARQGGFAPIPELGSRLYLLTREKPSAWESLARAYAQEAVNSLGLRVREAEVRAEGDVLYVTLSLYDGTNTATLEVRVN